MLVLEFKAYGKPTQFNAIDKALRTVQFIRNKALRFWMDGLGKTQYDLNKYCAVLASEFPFCNELNSMARQASAERAWSAIARFFDNCKKKNTWLRPNDCAQGVRRRLTRAAKKASRNFKKTTAL